MAVDLSKITNSEQLVNEAQRLEARIAAAEKYIRGQQAKGNAKTVAGATQKLNELRDQREQVFQLGASGAIPGLFQNGREITTDNPYTTTRDGQTVAYNSVFGIGPFAPTAQGTAESGGEAIQQVAPLPAETGNPVVDQANVLASILNSPLYTESIKNAYLTQYLPGLTQANYEINRARAQEVQNSFLRQQAQAQAIREIAGSYAARGMRTPKMVTEGFAPVQQATEMETAAAQQAINDLVANKEVLFGTGATSQETFITDPVKFGSVGAGARRTALSELLALPEAYGLTQVAQANRSPFSGGTQGALPGGAPNLMPTVTGEEVTQAPSGQVTPTPYDTRAVAQLQARIDAANRYIGQQQAKRNPTTVAGAQRKLAGYQSELKALRGY